MAKATPKTKVELLHSCKLAKLWWLVHAFSTRPGGVSRAYGGNTLNLGFTARDSRAAVERNRELFLSELGVVNGGKSWPLVTLRQIHSDLIHRVDAPPMRPPAGDGLITDTPELLLAVQAADCLPVVVADRKRRAVGVFHAGWRGTVKRIVEKGVGEMRKHFGSDPRNLVAAIGPGIRACCYEVGAEVRAQFDAQFAYSASLFREIKERDPVREKYPLLFLTARAPGHSESPVKLFLDLVEANRRQLLDAGVLAGNIDASALWRDGRPFGKLRTGSHSGSPTGAIFAGRDGPTSLCTACHPELFFSFRGDKGVTGRLMGVAGIRRDIRSSGT